MSHTHEAHGHVRVDEDQRWERSPYSDSIAVSITSMSPVGNVRTAPAGTIASLRAGSPAAVARPAYRAP